MPIKEIPNKSNPVALFVSDLHTRLDKPEYRKEQGSFFPVIAEKLKTVFDYADGHSYYEDETLPIFFSGDMFNSARNFMQLWSLFMLIENWNKQHDRKLKLYSVRGQHDMQNHNINDNATSFNLLVKYDVLHVLGGLGSALREIVKVDNTPNDSFVSIYGCGWGEDYPVPSNPNDQNVMILHKTMWYRESVFPGQTDGNVSVESIKLHELGYNTVFSGDNHKAFDVKLGGVQFHNIGAFTRNSVDLVNQQPRFCVLKSDMSVESIYVGNKDVFDLVRSTDDKSHSRSKDEFSEALAGGYDHGDTFEGAIDKAIGAGKCGDLELTAKQLNILRDVRANM